MAWFEEKTKSITVVARQASNKLIEAFAHASIKAQQVDGDNGNLHISFEDPLDGKTAQLTISTHNLDNTEGGPMGTDIRVCGFDMNSYTIVGISSSSEYGDSFDHTQKFMEKFLPVFNERSSRGCNAISKLIHHGLGESIEQGNTIKTTGMRKRYNMLESV